MVYYHAKDEDLLDGGACIALHEFQLPWPWSIILLHMLKICMMVGLVFRNFNFCDLDLWPTCITLSFNGRHPQISRHPLDLMDKHNPVCNTVNYKGHKWLFRQMTLTLTLVSWYQADQWGYRIMTENMSTILLKMCKSNSTHMDMIVAMSVSWCCEAIYVWGQHTGNIYSHNSHFCKASKGGDFWIF